jgi:hypothetical protein
MLREEEAHVAAAGGMRRLRGGLERVPGAPPLLSQS